MSIYYQFRFLFLVCLVSLALLCLSVSVSRAVVLSEHPKLLAIADELVNQKLYTNAELEQVFAQASYKQSVLDAIQSPAEYSLTWGRYRQIFLKEDRIQQGVEFWKEHQTTFDRAEREFGVPASMIVAIIGVESKYGKFKGAHKVMDSLVTLTTGFPRRSAFFGSELKEFLILTKRNNIDPLAIYGSYAGAVGYPQFISSSYRNYAVDFSGDGVTDLIDQPVDAIGSVANYFVENGWKPGQPVTSRAIHRLDSRLVEIANRQRKTPFTAASLRAKGALLDESIDDSQSLNLLMLDASDRKKYKNKSSDYIVRAGDTICQIAEAHKVSCRSLVALNKINPNGDIYRDQRLKIPHGSSTPASATVEADEVVPRYFYTYPNFYAITRYNQSVLYAMSVYELSNAIAEAKRLAEQDDV